MLGKPCLVIDISYLKLAIFSSSIVKSDTMYVPSDRQAYALRFYFPAYIYLTSIQHACKSRLLGRGDSQRPVALDGDVGARVGAVEALQRRLPRVGGLVALGRVDVVGDGPELGPGDVVGELLALGRGPLARARDPGVLEGHHVVDVDVGRGRPLGAVVGARPGAAGRVAVRPDHDAGAVALEHVLARVAGPRDGVPRGEQVAVVGGGVDRRGDGEAGQLRLGGRGGRDSRLELSVSFVHFRVQGCRV